MLIRSPDRKLIHEMRDLALFSEVEKHSPQFLSTVNSHQ